MYAPESWSIERHWKLSWQPSLFNGTPIKNIAWRLLGVRIGKRVFDDGCLMTEKPMITIGDDCVLNAGSTIQPHSQEDGTFKSDYVTIGTGCTIGIGALVHYGVNMGDGASLAANAFLMKGTEVPPHTDWGENPARELGDDRPDREVSTNVMPAQFRVNGIANNNGGNRNETALETAGSG
jgi:non-ribosomal peptide synthetase-like protein